MTTEINRDTNFLSPVLVKQWLAAQAEAHAAGLMVYIFEGYRSPERQQFLYDTGRSKPGRIITNAKPFQSWHCFGLAVDIVFDGELAKPGIQWSWAKDYKVLSKIMMKHGFNWSGKWNKLTGGLSGELCHFEITHGLKLAETKTLYDKDGLKGVWEAVEKKAY